MGPDSGTRPIEVRRPVHSRQTELGEKTHMSPMALTRLAQAAIRVISTFSSDPDLDPCPQNLHRGEASGPPESVGQLEHLLGGRSRSSGMPPAGYADSVTNDGPVFHSNARNYARARPLGAHQARHSSHRGKCTHMMPRPDHPPL
jgi:hypothetical protein